MSRKISFGGFENSTNQSFNVCPAVILPFLVGFWRRIYAASCSFWAGVMPPMPMFGRSWL